MDKCKGSAAKYTAYQQQPCATGAMQSHTTATATAVGAASFEPFATPTAVAVDAAATAQAIERLWAGRPNIMDRALLQVAFMGLDKAQSTAHQQNASPTLQTAAAAAAGAADGVTEHGCSPSKTKQCSSDIGNAI